MEREAIVTGVWGGEARTFNRVDMSAAAETSGRFEIYVRRLGWAEAMHLTQRLTSRLGSVVVEAMSSGDSSEEEVRQTVMRTMIWAMASIDDWPGEVEAMCKGVAVAICKGGDPQVAGAVFRLDREGLELVFGEAPLESIVLVWRLGVMGIGPLGFLRSLLGGGPPPPQGSPTSSKGSAMPSKRGKP